MSNEDAQESAKCGSFEIRTQLAALQRAGCMALRNICARCPELRNPLLATGAEKVPLRLLGLAVSHSAARAFQVGTLFVACKACLNPYRFGCLQQRFDK